MQQVVDNNSDWNSWTGRKKIVGCPRTKLLQFLTKLANFSSYRRPLSQSLNLLDKRFRFLFFSIFCYLPTPLAGGQRKIICGANEISWPPAGGVGMIFSAPVSIFNVLPQGGSFVYSPEGAITHFWGILDSVSNFQCATPRGLIRLPT